MNIYKTQENPSKNELLHNSTTKESGTEYIDQYVINYITAVYGGVYATYFKTNKDKYIMSIDKWHEVKDTLPKGHYFIEKDDLIGYTIYVVCETIEIQSGYMWDTSILVNNIIKVSSIFGVMKNITMIDQSIVGVREINTISDELYHCEDNSSESYIDESDSDSESTDMWNWRTVTTKRIKELTDKVNAEYIVTSDQYETIGQQINVSIKKMNSI